MTGAAFNADAFKAQMRDQWSAVADAWRKRWPAFERSAQPLSNHMMELAQVGVGKRVLDVATGIGEPALTAARLVGPSGAVVAVDQAPQMLTIARERAQSEGFSNVEFIEADAEKVTLPAHSFNAIVSRWGIMFFSDPVASLTRLRASLLAGGRFVAAVWGAPEKVPMITLSYAALGGAQTQQSGGFMGPGPFSLANAAELERVVNAAGYGDVRSEPYLVTYEFATLDDYIGHVEETSAPFRAALMSKTPDEQAQIHARLASSAMPFTDAQGTVRLPNQCLIVSGVA
jgi:SAM-dependent methyltransferase